MILLTRWDNFIHQNQSTTPWDSAPRFPPVKVCGHKDDLTIRFQFALAGYDKDSVEVKFADDYLILSLSVEDKKEDGWNTIYSSMKETKNVYYKYYVPSSKFDTTRTEASFNNGVLTVTIPIAEERKPKLITIK